MKKLALIIAVLAFAPMASASTITVNGISGQAVSITETTVLGGTLDVWAGALTVTGDLGSFEAYCVDLGHDLSLHTSYRVTEPVLNMSNWTGLGGAGSVTPTAGSMAAWLYNSYRASSSTSEQKAGLQLAIWEVLYDTNSASPAANRLSDGSFTATGLTLGAAQWASTLLGAVPVTPGPYGDASWLQLKSLDGRTDNQDLIAPPVPEPGSMMLFGTGLIGLASAVRRRIKK